MSGHEATIGALSTSVTALDASRRVGWARAYEAEASRDDLLRELNLARHHADLYQRKLSFLHGVLFGLLKMYRINGAHLVIEAVGPISSYLSDGPRAAGWRLASAVKEFQRKETGPTAKKRRQRERQWAEYLICRHYGLTHDSFMSAIEAAVAERSA